MRKSLAHTYLYNDSPRIHPYEREGPRAIKITLPLPQGGVDTFMLRCDERDQRVIVIFDGDIPWNGLPRAAGVLAQISLQPLSLTRHHIRKPREFEETAPVSLHVSEFVTTLRLQRQFLLLPGGSALVRRYKPESFAGQYTLIEVTHKDSVTEVLWRNSSY